MIKPTNYMHDMTNYLSPNYTVSAPALEWRVARRLGMEATSIRLEPPPLASYSGHVMRAKG